MTLKRIYILIGCTLFLQAMSCEKNGNDNTNPGETSNEETPDFQNLDIRTDKAKYAPGEEVAFYLDNENLPSNATVYYKYLNQVIDKHPLENSSWTWSVPASDYTGYLVEIADESTIYATIAIDVSSSWTKFPRYGFLSDYGQLSDDEIESVLNNLNRHHINGIQFYDWHNKHHMPLAVNGSEPAESWKNIGNDDVYLTTVEKYIAGAHDRNMSAMFYNLIYGAWNNAEQDGVDEEWYIYKDETHTNKDFIVLDSPPFLSNIFLLDPSNSQWQEYLLNENDKVYQHLDFDGFHMDQLGDRGESYTYEGTFFNLSETYKSFIEADHAAQPEKLRVMNAVNQYGQAGIAESPSDFLYTEVWDPHDTYADLSNIIKQNNVLSDNTKNTVLTAYVNYDLAEERGYFNTASVLMTNAVIFAFGGAHLELGEHMLGKEYFPNNNLDMKADLKTTLVSYYDFLTAYQNLLRDGGSFNSVNIFSIDDKLSLAEWPASQGFVATIGKQADKSQVIHFINFTDASTLQWRDNTGTQIIPALIKNAQMEMSVSGTVLGVWTASPDIIGSASRSINFIQEGSKLRFTLPELKYWSMVVIEFE